jgi:hypothetical protein
MSLCWTFVACSATSQKSLDFTASQEDHGRQQPQCPIATNSQQQQLQHVPSRVSRVSKQAHQQVFMLSRAAKSSSDSILYPSELY